MTTTRWVTAKPSGSVARHPHLVPLAVAYAVTGDERYVRLVTSQIDSWIAQNPFVSGGSLVQHPGGGIAVGGLGLGAQPVLSAR